LEPTPEHVFLERLQTDSDFFHPGGTTRMGRDVHSGVLDADLRTYRIDNLYVVSTSAFPSGGGANPTFMLMAIALRAAEHVARRVEAFNSALAQ
jgi:choline dehydrogenase-like flavoprotein